MEMMMNGRRTMTSAGLGDFVVPGRRVQYTGISNMMIPVQHSYGTQPTNFLVSAQPYRQGREGKKGVPVVHRSGEAVCEVHDRLARS